MKKTFNKDNWKEFEIEKYFEVKGTKTTKKENISPGKFAYITTKNTFNGWESSAHDYSEKGKVITIDSATDGASFYQEKNFFASDHVEKIYPKDKELNHYIAFFLIAILNFNNQEKYSYGRKRNQGNIKREKMLLPADALGNPDWQWMEDYVKEIFNEVKVEVIQALELDTEREREREEINSTCFNPSEWKEFFLGNEKYFCLSKAKNPLILSKYEEQYLSSKQANTVPVISATSQNNGLVGFIEQIKAEKENGKTITIVKDGVHCATAFYQPFDFYANSHIFILQVNKKNELDKFSAFFLCLLIGLEKFRYSFGRALTIKDATKTKIFLPVNKSGEINWEYMEKIVKTFYKGVVNNFKKELGLIF